VIAPEEMEKCQCTTNLLRRCCEGEVGGGSQCWLAEIGLCASEKLTEVVQSYYEFYYSAPFLGI
jgi:hypothetical protein